MVLKINPQNPQARLVRRVVEILEEGGIIVYPTDTFYGIGCDLLNRRAIERIYQIKKRRHEKPFSFICADLKDISNYAKVSDAAYKTMKRLLPGPYTFILEGTKLVPKIMQTNRKTVGIRVPDNQICLDIVKTLARPIISTSAILPGQDMVMDIVDLEDMFGPRVDALIDGGSVTGEPSSVVSLIDDRPEIIREGIGDLSSFQ
jgi:tRNA threonylcarbamoyl adenosine modification protein (Sua5/YciO/YrdC/YwlC family)